jgi:serine/threonine-protein kinase
MEAAPNIPVQIGDVLLGKYVVEKVIGAGGMGVVVAVRHRELGELYAMKFMLPAALVNDQAVERFVREARAAAKLKSEHVASVTDVGRLESGSPYMVMDYLTGMDLEKVVETSGPLNGVTAATYIMQACDAIAEAHEAGIVHRDLKPANLFLTKRPSGSPCIKVLDFGISKSVNPEEQAGSMTRTTAIMGSPYYMSPEQMRSTKNVDHRTDIWALGVILYQLTTGRVPFPGDTITEVCAGVLAEEPPPLVPSYNTVSPELEMVIRRCLSKRADQRFQSARELMAALAVVAGASPGTSGLNLPNPVATMALQHPPVMLQAPAITQAGHAGVGPGATQAGWGTTQSKPKSGAPIAALAVIGALLLGGAAGGYYFLVAKPAETRAASAPPETAAAKPVEAEAPTPEPVASAEPTAAEPTATASAEAPPEASNEVATAPTAKAHSGGGGGGKTKPPPTAKPTAAPVAPPTAQATTKPHGIL